MTEPEVRADHPLRTINIKKTGDSSHSIYLDYAPGYLFASHAMIIGAGYIGPFLPRKLLEIGPA